MVRQILHMIDGQEVPSLSGATFDSFDPATEEQIATVAFGEEADVDRAVQSARAAFASGVWSGLAPAERARVMRRIADAILAREEELAECESRDTGSPLSNARADVKSAASIFEYFSQTAEHVFGRTYATPTGYFAYSRREPYGVVGAIAPWNFPLVLACWKTAPALAVGNSVVLKMAEQSPMTTSLLANLALQAGLPAGVMNTVHGDGPTTGAALVSHPDVPKLTFTGSTNVGKAILASASEHVKSVHLELGGKTPNIVFPDADLDQAIKGTLFTSFFNSGQICTSGSRPTSALQCKGRVS